MLYRFRYGMERQVSQATRAAVAEAAQLGLQPWLVYRTAVASDEAVAGGGGSGESGVPMDRGCRGCGVCGACGTQAEVRRDVEMSWQLDRHEMELGGEDEAEEQGEGGREAVSRVGVEHTAHRRGQAPWQEAEQSSKRSRHKTPMERRRHKAR